MSQLFTSTDAWHGSFYELVFELPEASEITAKRALSQLWAYPSLEGCFLHANMEPAEQRKVSPLDAGHEGHWYGVATFPNGKKSCCGSFWANYQSSGSWVTFYLPLGSLGNAYPVRAYPLNVKGEASPEFWLKTVNAWLQAIAVSIYPQVRFKIAIIGHEVDFFKIKAKLAEGLPTNRWEGLLIPSSHDLVWHPPTTYEPPYTIEKRLR